VRPAIGLYATYVAFPRFLRTQADAFFLRIKWLSSRFLALFVPPLQLPCAKGKSPPCLLTLRTAFCFCPFPMAVFLEYVSTSNQRFSFCRSPIRQSISRRKLLTFFSVGGLSSLTAAGREVRLALWQDGNEQFPPRSRWIFSSTTPTTCSPVFFVWRTPRSPPAFRLPPRLQGVFVVPKDKNHLASALFVLFSTPTPCNYTLTKWPNSCVTMYSPSRLLTTAAHFPEPCLSFLPPYPFVFDFKLEGTML